MSNLARLFEIFSRMAVDEIRLDVGSEPYVIAGGEMRNIGTQPMNARQITAVAAEVVPIEELREMPSQRPRVVRHAHEGETYLIEIARSMDGLSIVIRRARPAKAKIEAVVEEPMREAVGAGIVRAQAQPQPARTPNLAAAAPRFAPPPAEPTPAPVAVRRESAVTPAVRLAPSDRGAGKKIDGLLRKMIESEASDLHLSAGAAAVMRVHGEICFLRERVLSSSEIETMMREIMPAKASTDFDALRDADFAYEIPGLARFRVNVFEDRNGTGAVMRQIPVTIRTVAELGLPKACLDLCFLSKGLVVVTGPTGSGKSTTLASMIDYINDHRTDHIITIEDPVEFVHPNKKCLVNQREVGQNTRSFKNALRAALREDPDIVLVGEMRDLETIAIAIETAETGHLVFGTLHTTTAVSTVDRIIDQFPTDRQAQIRVMLSESLKGVVAQGLCKKVGGGRVAAHEILLGTTAVSALIREGKTFQIPSIMQTSKGQGMVTMNDSLFALVQKGLVDPKEAMLKAVDKAGLTAMFKGANIPTSFI